MGLLGSRDYGMLRTEPSTRTTTGTAYGCTEWEDCDSRQIGPPYNPKQPEKCRRHKKFMRTLIEEDS